MEMGLEFLGNWENMEPVWFPSMGVNFWPSGGEVPPLSGPADVLHSYTQLFEQPFGTGMTTKVLSLM